MATRIARCRCGQLSATCTGDPVRVSVCHCRGCRRLTGGALSAQARFPAEAVTLAGAFQTWECVGDSGEAFVEFGFLHAVDHSNFAPLVIKVAELFLYFFKVGDGKKCFKLSDERFAFNEVFSH